MKFMSVCLAVKFTLFPVWSVLGLLSVKASFVCLGYLFIMT